MPDIGLPFGVVVLGAVAAGGLILADRAGLLNGSGGASASGSPATGSVGQGGSTGTGALSARASTLLTPGQQTFASELQRQTGFNPNFIAAWLYAEENGSAAAGRQASNNHDWLNIGYTDTATFGASDSIWSSPITAADATAAWIKGSKDAIPGYGQAAPSIQALAGTAGQSASAQVAALQSSGWASGGYPDLTSILNMFGG